MIIGRVVAGEPVVSKFRRIARTLNLVVVAGFAVATLAACPYARGEPAGATPPSAVPTLQAKSAPDTATVQGPDSRINTSEIVKRVNKELGIDLAATTAGWQRGLDRLESDLARPRQHYSDLNRFRDELQRIRFENDDAWKKIRRGSMPIHAVKYFTPLLMPGLILKARGHDIRKGHLGWTFWSPPGLPGGGITGVFPALGVGTLMAGSMSGGQMTPAVWSSFSLSVA
jgi:hypothetical protein